MCIQIMLHFLHIQFAVYGVPGPGVGELEIKVMLCGLADPGPAETDAGRGEFPQKPPRIIHNLAVPGGAR